jgi:MFS family permease
MKFLPEAFNSKHFAVFFAANILTYNGIQIFMFAESWIVHELNESPEALGLLGLYVSLPALIFNLFGGALSDRFSKKLIVSIAQSFQAIICVVFAYYYGIGALEYWHVYIIAAIISFSTAFELPAKMSYFPSLIDKKYLSSGVVVDMFAWQGTRVIAPLIAGYVFAIYGGGAALIISSILIMVFIGMFLSTKPIQKTEKLQKGNPITDVLDGLKYIYQNKPIFILLSMSFVVFLSGYPYLNMLPYIAVQIFEVSSKGTGILMTSAGIGSVLPTIIFSKAGIPDKRLGVCFAMIFSGLFLIIFTSSSLLIQSIPLAMILIMIMGFSNSLYATSVMSAIQIFVSDQYRARVVGVFVMSFSFMSLGSLWVGTLGGYIDNLFSLEHTGVLISLMFGGLVLLIVGLLTYLFNNSLKEIS